MGPNWKYFLRLPHLILSKVLLFFTSDCFIVFFSSTVPLSFPACLLLLKSSVTEIPFPLKILEDVVCLRIFSLSLTLLKVATIGLTWKIWIEFAESFYYLNYGSSIILSKVSQIISVMKTKINYISEIVHFGIFIQEFKTTETPVFMFSLLRLFD